MRVLTACLAGFLGLGALNTLPACSDSTALVVVIIMRNMAARQIAEIRAASIAELTAARQDLKWVREDAERKTQALDSAQSLLDKTEHRLRDTFQALAARFGRRHTCRIDRLGLKVDDRVRHGDWVGVGDTDAPCYIQALECMSPLSWTGRGMIHRFANLDDACRHDKVSSVFQAAIFPVRVDRGRKTMWSC